MRKVNNVKALLLTFCAVGVLTAANQSWADFDVTNCAQVSATAETDTDSTPANMVGTTVAEDDESCAPLTVNIVHDFGDAPDSYGTTAGAQQEIVPWLQLGPSVDDEAAGAPSVPADGDGTDEDGVVVPPMQAGAASPNLTITATNTSGADAYVACWVDYDQNGTFDDSEFGMATVPSDPAAQSITVDMSGMTVPVTATTNDAGDVDSYARCRLSNVQPAATDAANVLNDATGVADGEVEDYPVNFTDAPVFDLALKKTLSASEADANVNPGEDVTFTIEVINQGDVDATDIVITDYIPAGLTLKDTNWTAIDADSDGTAETAVLNTPMNVSAADGSKTVDITFTVAADAPVGALTNTAEISAAVGGTDQDSTPDANNDDAPVKDDVVSEDAIANPGVDDEDDHDIATITVNPLVDLGLVKTIEDGTGNPVASARRGDTVVYVLTVTNDGPHKATGVAVGDLLPTGVTYDSDNAASVVDSTGTATSYDSGTGVWNIGQLDAPASIELRITVTVD